MKIFLVAFLLLIASLTHAQNITVMSYNIRLDYEGDGPNKWEYRKNDMVKQVMFYDPVFLGIQEGLPNQVKYLKENLVGYDYIGVGRDDGQEKGEFSAIYYKTALVKLIKGSTFWLSETPDRPSKGWDAALPRVCTYGLFAQGKKQFWVFNTHFDHMGATARLESMKLIVAKIAELNTSHLPVVLMGDLNSEPAQEPVLEMKKSFTDTKETALLALGPDATFNAFDFATIPQKRIDYVAVSRGWKVYKHAVLTDSKERRYYSDHFAVYCVLSVGD